MPRKSSEKIKKVVVKKRPKNRDHSNVVSHEDAEEMFRLWCQIRDQGKGGGYKGVAERFGRDIKTVRRVAAKNNWKDRFRKILLDIQKRTDKKVVQEKVSNIKLARALRDKTLKKLLRKNTELNPSIRDGIEIMRYEDELSGNLPDERENELAATTAEQLDRTLKIIESLGGKAVNLLADFIVNHNLE